MMGAGCKLLHNLLKRWRPAIPAGKARFVSQRPPSTCPQPWAVDLLEHAGVWNLKILLSTCSAGVVSKDRPPHLMRLPVDGVGDVDGLLRLVWVRGALVNLQMVEQLSPKAALGKHALHCRFHDALWNSLRKHTATIALGSMLMSIQSPHFVSAAQPPDGGLTME